MAFDPLEPDWATSRRGVDADLIKKAQAYLECKRKGDVPSDVLTQGWETFYRRCDSAIRRFAVHCGAPSVADCSQDVWRTLLLELGGFEIGPGCPSFFSWLFRIVRNKAIDQLRERTRHPTQRLADRLEEPISPQDDPAAAWDRQLLRSQVHHVLRELAKQIPECSYRILHMHWIEGHPLPEIARRLNLTIEQVWTRHHRAKQKFRWLFELCQDNEGRAGGRTSQKRQLWT